MKYFSDLLSLFKAASHKYVRRIPYTDKNGRKRYKYYYRNQTLRGASLGDLSEIVNGAAYEFTDDLGRRGHLTIQIDAKTNVVLATHDETGKVLRFKDIKQFQRFIREHHIEEIKTDKETFYRRLREERKSRSIRVKLTERRAEFLGLTIPNWETLAPDGMIDDINDFSHLRYRLKLFDKIGRLVPKWVTEETARRIIEGQETQWVVSEEEPTRTTRTIPQDEETPSSTLDAQLENHKRHAAAFRYDFETTPAMIHPSQIEENSKLRMWVRPKGSSKWIPSDESEAFSTSSSIFYSREIIHSSSKDMIGAGGIPKWKALFLQAEEHGLEAVFADPDTRVIQSEGRREAVSLSAGKPPNFLGLDVEKFNFDIVKNTVRGRTYENIEIKRDDAVLQRLGFYDAVGIGRWANTIFDVLFRASRGEELTGRQESIIAQGVSRLALWWSGLNDDEREEFYHGYLNAEKQVLGTLRHPLHENADFEIPQGMEKMRERGWTFHEYQKKAINFAVSQKRVVWAMEMGLGKTLSALGAYHEMKNKGDVAQMFITAPLSAHGSWIEHLGQLSNVRYEVLSGVSKKKRLAAYDRFKRGEIDVLVTSPEAIRAPKGRGAGDFEHISELISENTLFVADEVHKYKTSKSSQGESFEILSAQAGACIGMTGTPKPNKPEDFYHIMARVNPEWEITQTDFINRYCLTDDEGNAITFNPARLWEFQEINATQLFVRSTNDPDARLDLPDRRDLSPSLTLDDIQEKFIFDVGEMTVKKAEAASCYRRLMNVDNPYMTMDPREISLAHWFEECENKVYAVEQGQIDIESLSDEDLEFLTTWQASTTATKPLVTRIDQITTEPRSAAPLFWDEFLSRQGHENYESPKMKLVADAAIEHLETHPETGAVVFCEYIAALESARDAFIRRGIPAEQIEMYYGAVSPKKRREIERKLNEGEIKIVLGQTKALETGANLQKRANFVAHLNTPFAPDTLTQSTARVYRQGQRRPTTILRPTGSEIDQIRDRVVTRKISQTGQATGAVMVADEGAIRTTADARRQKLDAETLARFLKIPDLANVQTDEQETRKPQPDQEVVEEVAPPPPKITGSSTNKTIIKIGLRTETQWKKAEKGQYWAQSATSSKNDEQLEQFLNVTIFKGKLHTDDQGFVVSSDMSNSEAAFWAGAYSEILRTIRERQETR